MPFAQWPGMWQPTNQPLAALAASSGTVQVTSSRWPDSTTIRVPSKPGGSGTNGVGPGRRVGGCSLSRLPGQLVLDVADDGLVDDETRR